MLLKQSITLDTMDTEKTEVFSVFSISQFIDRRGIFCIKFVGKNILKNI